MNLHFRNHAPYSETFQDIYFNPENSLAETEHVFLEANQLKKRLQQTEKFQIGELGFGTGLNFLATLKFWQSLPQPKAELHYFSIEKYPIPAEQLKSIHKDFSILEEAYPPTLNGFYQITVIPNRVYLYLLFGDVQTMLPQMAGPIDAWFLDGFAPSKNPEMWTDTVFATIAKLSHAGTSLSTFSAAGIVKRGLESAGFTVNKRKGFGQKREMITASFSQQHQICIAPWFSKPKAKQTKTIAVIGAGLAGLMTAQQLQQSGFEIRVFDQIADFPNQQCQNPAMILRPYLSPNWNFFDQYLTAGFVGMRQFLRSRLPQAIITEAQLACVVNPNKLAEYLAQDLKLELGQQVDAFQLKQDYEAVIIATGEFDEFGTPTPGQVEIADGECQPMAYEGGYCVPNAEGQIVFGSSFRHGRALDFSEKDREYNLANLAKADPTLANNIQNQTFSHFVGMRYTTPDHLPIVGGLPIKAEWLKAYDRLRYGDKRPAYPACPYHEGIYVNLAHGSKGLASSFMASGILTALITGRPLSIGVKLWQAIHPARFWLRDLKHAQNKLHRHAD